MCENTIPVSERCQGQYNPETRLNRGRLSSDGFFIKCFRSQVILNFDNRASLSAMTLRKHPNSVPS